MITRKIHCSEENIFKYLGAQLLNAFETFLDYQRYIKDYFLIKVGELCSTIKN